MTFAIGVPLILVSWATYRKERSIVRLLSIYWKISILLLISMLFLINHNSIGYITLFIAPILMVSSVWFWVDLNEELIDLPPWRPLPLTVRIWRWSLTLYGIISLIMSIISLNCLSIEAKVVCSPWGELPNFLHNNSAKLFGFLFGANWTESLATFIGYILLIGYIVGILQWVLIKLPKQGRIAGGF